MSIEWMLWAFDQDCGNSGMKLVLLTLGNYADESGVCWPSQATLAKKTSMTDRSVRENLTRLESGGFIACRSRTTGKGTRTSNIYQLLGKTQRKILPMDADSSGKNCRRLPEESSAGPPEDSSYNPSTSKPHKNPQKESIPVVVINEAAAAADAAPSEITTSCAEYVAAVLELFVQATGRPPRLPSSADRTLALQLYDQGIPMNVIETAILQITGRNLALELQGQKFSRPRTLAYFMAAIQEQRSVAFPETFTEYLRFRIQQLRKQLDGPRQGELMHMVQGQ